MKYSTFTRLRLVAVAAVVALPVVAWFGCHNAPSAPVAPTSATMQQPPPQVPPQDNTSNAENPAPSVDTSAFTEVHQAILRLQKEPLSNGRPKGNTLQWVYKDAGIRAEFRCDKDKGFNYWNRVKIDYNGNGKDDERWDFKKDGTIKRRVAPNDDENFTETYTLQGDNKWVKQ
jgi:hypothetical protein